MILLSLNKHKDNRTTANDFGDLTVTVQKKKE